MTAVHFRNFRFPFSACFAAGCIVTMTVSCSSYQAKPLSVESGMAAFSGRTLSSAMQAAGEKVPGKWNFAALATASNQMHGEVRLARAQAETAKAALKGEREVGLAKEAEIAQLLAVFLGGHFRSVDSPHLRHKGLAECAVSMQAFIHPRS